MITYKLFKIKRPNGFNDDDVFYLQACNSICPTLVRVYHYQHGRGWVRTYCDGRGCWPGTLTQASRTTALDLLICTGVTLNDNVAPIQGS